MHPVSASTATSIQNGRNCDRPGGLRLPVMNRKRANSFVRLITCEVSGEHTPGTEINHERHLMFTSYYAVTKDRKGGIHQYRLATGEGVPAREEIVGLRVAGTHEFGSFVSKEDIQLMYAVAGKRAA